MSVHFGRWNFDARPIDRDYVTKVDSLLDPYGPDGGNTHSVSGMTMVYRTFHTTKESRREVQPHISESGLVLTWVGRLDNRSDLIGQIGDAFLCNTGDMSIVAAAYEKWRTGCFCKLTGDWALSIWDPSERTLWLAKDLIGTCPLFYHLEKNRITWSSLLDPLVLLTEGTLTLDEEYMAGWLGSFPATHLTPYTEIRSVRPACYVVVRNGEVSERQFREFKPTLRIRYRSDSEYEEHFRVLLSQSIRRRLRADGPVLAELSGGFDSSSIVCMADQILESGADENQCRLDTLSYYDDSEPNWNERPFFTVVEAKRGRTGCHVDVSGQKLFPLRSGAKSFSAMPGAVSGGDSADLLDQFFKEQGNRVLLSGMGGDELLGGLPAPAPELRDLIASADFKMLLQQLKKWALTKRKPWLHVLWDAAREFLPTIARTDPNPLLPWLTAEFQKKHWNALAGYPRRDQLFGPRPSFQWNMRTLEYLRGQLSCAALSARPLCERRYPYLDADLMEFLFAIPREQLVRPGQRRSLMRRSLTGIVPDAILNRKRKAFVVRSIMTGLSESQDLIEMCRQMTSASIGIVNDKAFREAVQNLGWHREISLVAMIRTIALEFWLRDMEGRISLSPVSSGASEVRSGESREVIAIT